MPIINWWGKIWKSIEDHEERKYQLSIKNRKQINLIKPNDNWNYSTTKVCYEVV